MDDMTLGPEAYYLQALCRGQFLFQRDGAGRAVFPPRLTSPYDGTALSWQPSRGLGRIFALTEQPRKPPLAPRRIALVDMDEGFRLVSRIEGAGEVAIGRRVIARIAAGPEPEAGSEAGFEQGQGPAAGPVAGSVAGAAAADRIPHVYFVLSPQAGQEDA